MKTPVYFAPPVSVISVPKNPQVSLGKVWDSDHHLVPNNGVTLFEVERTAEPTSGLAQHALRPGLG